MSRSAEVRCSRTPTLLFSGVDIRPCWTRVRSLDASPFLAHVARLARETVFAVADLVGSLRVGRAGEGGSDVKTVVGKKVAVLASDTHLVDFTEKALRPFVGNLHVLAILRWGFAQVGRVEAEFLFADHVNAIVGAATGGSLKEWELDAFLETLTKSIDILCTVLICYAVCKVWEYKGGDCWLVTTRNKFSLTRKYPLASAAL